MQIKVLQHHIEQGVRRNAFHCPIAQAIREQCGVQEVSVGPHVFIHGLKYVLPQAGIEFIVSYDRDQSVEPFTFELKEFQQ